MKNHIYKIIKNVYISTNGPTVPSNEFLIYRSDSNKPIGVCSRLDINKFEDMLSIGKYPVLDGFYVIYKEAEDENEEDIVFSMGDYPCTDLIISPIGLKKVIGREDCLKALSLLGIKIGNEEATEKKEELEDSPFDPVLRPLHYTKGRKYEPKDVIRDWGLNFNLGNAVKYISRAGRKEDILQDLEKAMTYIRFEIDAIREEDQNESDNCNE